jgi:adenylate cyclase class 2
MPEYEEIECKFLDVDKNKTELLLVELGAKKEFDRIFKRIVFDYPDLRMHKEFAWLRLRDEGDRVTVSYKQRQGVVKGESDKGMKEIEITVDDFERTSHIFEAIGLKPKFYEENERIQYKLDGVEVVIDTWPLIPSYIEIEGSSWSEVRSVAEKLGFNWEDKVIYSTMQVYDKYGIHRK